MYIALYFVLKVPQPELHSTAHFNEWAKKCCGLRPTGLRAYGLATPLLESKADLSIINRKVHLIIYSVDITPSVCPFKGTAFCSIYLLCFKRSVVSNRMLSLC